MSGSIFGAIKIWDVDSSSCVSTFSCRAFSSCCQLSDGNIAAAIRDGVITVLDVATGAVIDTFVSSLTDIRGFRNRSVDDIQYYISLSFKDVTTATMTDDLVIVGERAGFVKWFQRVTR